MSRQDDIKIAKILGYTQIKPHNNGVISTYSGINSSGDRCGIPFFTSDCSDDYKVLEWRRDHYRKNLPSASFWTDEAFVGALDDILSEHSGISWDAGNVYEYEPGDYSRALLALDKQGLL